MAQKKAKLLFSLSILFCLELTQSHVVETLPGYPGLLPFKLETGYIGVGEDEDVQLFYYFIESERDPENDPLLFWHTGGPGCSGFSALVYEIGPLNFELSSFDGSLPSLLLNRYSWTKVASIIFIDAPVGTGFSYANTSRGYYTSDTESTNDSYMFLRKWLLNHPSFLKNRLYVAGDSYGGKIVPMFAFEIAKGNEAGLQPRMNLQGYMIGNPVMDMDTDSNEKVEYAHRLALISDEYYELAKSSCDGEYINPDPDNIRCLYALLLIKECTRNIFEQHILEPLCDFTPHRNDDIRWGQTIVQDFPENFLFLSKQQEPWCRRKNYWPSYIWARDKSVQKALHIREGTIDEEWARCNSISHYEIDARSVLKYHKLLNQKGYQILVYSGDHDMVVPYMSTLKWIHGLNLTVEDEWRPWTIGGQVAGYTEKYKNEGAYITFATVKGAGHTAPEYMPKQCFAMVLLRRRASGADFAMDSEDIARLVHRLNLRPDKEKDCLVLPANLAQLGQARLELSLVAKVFSPKAINRETFRSQMPKILQVSKKVEVEMVGENIFLLDFHSVTDRRRVLLEGPWNFFKDLVIFREPQRFKQPSEIPFSIYSIWVQLYNLPLAFMHPDILRSIGSQIGHVCEVDNDEGGKCTGKFARVRVTRNIDQPLLQGIWVQPEDVCDNVCVPILYERLPNFCFACGRIGHVLKDCEDPTANIESPAYGIWLRAPNPSANKKYQSSRNSTSSDNNSTSQATSKTGAIKILSVLDAGRSEANSTHSGSHCSTHEITMGLTPVDPKLLDPPSSLERIGSSCLVLNDQIHKSRSENCLSDNVDPSSLPCQQIHKPSWKRVTRSKGKEKVSVQNVVLANSISGKKKGAATPLELMAGAPASKKKIIKVSESHSLMAVAAMQPRRSS